MKNFFNSLKRQDGFTLVELMVVVAIIGLLSAVAIPNFKKYQAKAKTSEAKLQLSAVYTAMQSWYSDFDNYANCLNLMGFDPIVERPTRYYAVGFPPAATPPGNPLSVANGAPAACTGASVGNEGATTVAQVPTSSATNTSAFAAGKAMAGTLALKAADVLAANIVVAAPDILGVPTTTTWTAGAIGNIDASKLGVGVADTWMVNQNKRLISVRPGY